MSLLIAYLRKRLIKYEWVVRSYFFYTLVINILLFERNSERKRLFWQVRNHTLVGYQRLRNAWELCAQVNTDQVPGAFVECGVWRGGCAAVMAAQAHTVSPIRHSWFFDSFQGLPEPTTVDGETGKDLSLQSQVGRLQSIGQLVTQQTVVEQLMFQKLKLDKQYTHIIPGWFADTLPTTKNAIGQIAVLRVDSDWYQSTKECLIHLYDNVVTGGYIIVDDYSSWEGARKAVDEFISERKINAQLVSIDRAGIYWQKA